MRKKKLKVKYTKEVTEDIEVKHIHKLSNWMLWMPESAIYSWSGEGRILTKKGFVNYGKNAVDVIQNVTCRICNKTFPAVYNHVRWERMKKTGEYLPA